MRHTFGTLVGQVRCHGEGIAIGHASFETRTDSEHLRRFAVGGRRGRCGVVAVARRPSRRISERRHAGHWDGWSGVGEAREKCHQKCHQLQSILVNLRQLENMTRLWRRARRTKKPRQNPWSCGVCSARPRGLEPPTTGSTVRYSNQLSYGPFRETLNYICTRACRKAGLSPPPNS